jgi:hypothetical protein
VECLLTDHSVLPTIATFTSPPFSGVCIIGTLAGGFLLKAEAFSQKFCTHVFRVLSTGNIAMMRNVEWCTK